MRESQLVRLIAAAGLILSLMLVCAAPACALHARSRLSADDDPSPRFAVAADVALLNGEAHETTLINGGASKRSQLVWDLDDVIVGGLTVSGRMLHGLEMNFGFWMPLSEGRGSMNDYDWLVPGRAPEWSHWSVSPVDVTEGHILDVNVGWRFGRSTPVSAAVIAGFKRDHWCWEDFGGQYVYSTGSGFRNLSGTFADRVGVTYEQWISIPYIGVNATTRVGPLSLGSYFFVSVAAWAEDEDRHLLRNLVFERDADNMDYLGLGLYGDLALTPRLGLSMALDHQNLGTGVGATRTIDGDTGKEAYFPQSAGISQRTTSLVFSIVYTF